MKKLLKLLGVVVGVVFLIGLAGVIFGENPKSTTASASEEAASAPKAVKPVGVTASALFTAYEKNEVAADQQYKGKLLLVSGTVQSIDKGAFDDIVVKFRSSNEFMPVDAYLNKEHESLAASLEKGQKVTWTCKGAGRLIGSPILKNCTPA